MHSEGLVAGGDSPPGMLSVLNPYYQFQILLSSIILYFFAGPDHASGLRNNFTRAAPFLRLPDTFFGVNINFVNLRI